jgi:hypothetical protein
MNLSQLKEYVIGKGFEYPHLREKIYAAYQCAVSEVLEEGASESQEVNSCLSDIEDIIWDDNVEDNKEPDETCYE